MTLIFQDIGPAPCIRMRLQGVLRLTSHEEHSMSTICKPSRARIDRSLILNGKVPTRSGL